MEYALIITIVNRGFADDVMDAAKKAGATGGTISHARGFESQEAAKFFGITIQPEKDTVMILAPEEKRKVIMQAICTGAGLSTEARGITFALPVSDVAGFPIGAEKTFPKD